MTWVDGSSFCGAWKYDERHDGEMRFNNGNLYKGTFLKDKLHGEGRLFLVQGVIFEGNFTAGSCDSIGKMLYPNGDIYFGTQKGFIKDG